MRAVKKINPMASKRSASVLPDPRFVSRHTAQLRQPASWATLHCPNLLLAAVALLDQDASSVRHHLLCKDTLSN